jgi:2',3'-cyclic-nucleotide 2'-phosphodiesterase (5'-nucleotidase family)
MLQPNTLSLTKVLTMTKPLIPWILGTFVSIAATEQPSAPNPVAAPMRDLPWGDLNFLQTTDTHGWQAGHLQE